MKFNLLAFRSVVFWFAIIGLFGNQVLIGIKTLDEISTHNEAVRIFNRKDPPKDGAERALRLQAGMVVLAQGTDIWEPRYFRLLNPAFPFENINSWDLLNHLLAWGGSVAALIWIALKFSMRKDGSEVAPVS